MQAAAAEELGVEPAQVGVASTGVIGIELPREPVRRAACARPCAALGDDADDFSQAILTSDRGPEARLPRGRAAGRHACASRRRPRAPG